MKKVLVILVLLISTSVFAQSEGILDDPFTRSITQKDLPIGKSFVVMPLDGTTTFGGVIDDLTISYLPRNTPFILKYDGGKPMKYNIYDYRN
jgi:hypothetical protein|tara:strand:+ start:3196 stop:3471 length:276 start_codon:yes stop_codon:yes gene_type:complete